MRSQLEIIVKCCVIPCVLSGVISAWGSAAHGESPPPGSTPGGVDSVQAQSEIPCAPSSEARSPEQNDHCGMFTPDQHSKARAYLSETAHPGWTMIQQGPLAIERLHPEFVIRLANAIAEARSSGMPEAGVFSAYRPPAFGVGGFLDKFDSLHAYGLAVDMWGIGPPGSPGAERWHLIAARHGIACPYGSRHRAEWNHCQPTLIKAVRSENRLRETISAEGPVSLATMFNVGNSFIAGVAETAASAAALARDPSYDSSSVQPKVAKVDGNGGPGTRPQAPRRRITPTRVSSLLSAKRSAKERPKSTAGDNALKAAIQAQKQVSDRVIRIYSPEN